MTCIKNFEGMAVNPLPFCALLKELLDFQLSGVDAKGIVWYGLSV